MGVVVVFNYFVLLHIDCSTDKNNNNHDDIYSAVIMTEVIARVHSVYLENVEQCHCQEQPPTLRPSHLTWAVSPPDLGSYHLEPPFYFCKYLAEHSDALYLN